MVQDIITLNYINIKVINNIRERIIRFYFGRYLEVNDICTIYNDKN